MLRERKMNTLSKTFGERDKQGIFLKARQTTDHEIMAIGTAYDLSFTTGFILLCKKWMRAALQPTIILLLFRQILPHLFQPLSY